MNRAKRLRWCQRRDVFRIVADGRDAARDGTAWRRHLIERTCALLGAASALAGEGAWRPPDGPQFGHVEQCGQAPIGSLDFVFNMQKMGGGKHPLRLLTDVHRPADGEGAGHALVSAGWFGPAGRMHMLLFRRPTGGPAFTTREPRLVHVLHHEVIVLLSAGKLGAVPTPADAGPRLSPRQRQTLDALCQGLSEKEVAARLGVGRTTVHTYCQMLYRQFGVSSRGELLARCLGGRAVASDHVAGGES